MAPVALDTRGDVPTFSVIDEQVVDSLAATVYEHGWQSWSPTTTYSLGERPHRPVSEHYRVIAYRGSQVAPAEAYQGEGLLVIDAGDGRTVLYAAADPCIEAASIRVATQGDRLTVLADGPVVRREGSLGIDAALTAWADEVVLAQSVPAPRLAPTFWCSWYEYWTEVTETDVIENLEAMDSLELPIDVVQLDDGYQAGMGDWLSLSDRFESLPALVSRIASHGRRTGIWTAPFLVGSASRVALAHPDWIVRTVDSSGADGAPVNVGHNWDQHLYALDTTHPGARDYLREVFATFTDWGIDFFKIDFIYAGAVDGRRHDDVSGVQAYRSGLELIRESIGDGYLLGCGAPILPSIGLVDAMRVSPDTDPEFEHASGDLSQPAQRSALLTGRARQFMNKRFWLNDPDCLIVRSEVERRMKWAAHVKATQGLIGCSDRLLGLDEWGLETTRKALAEGKARQSRIG